jgi:hypothetical protein
MLLAVTAGVTGISGCGGQTRSVQAYCSYFYGQGAKLRQRYIQAGQNAKHDPIDAIATLLASPQDLADFFQHLSDRAPTDISDDVGTLSKAFQKEADSEGDAAFDPLKALGSGLISGLATVPAEERVNSYTEQNCGPPPTGGAE